MIKTEAVIIIGAAVLIFGAPLLKALANGMDQVQVAPQPGAVLDPAGGPTRVQDPTAVPRPTPQPIFSTQVIGGDVVSNDFVPYGADISTIDRIDVVIDVATDVGGAILPFVFNPIGGAIDGILNIFSGSDC